MPRKEGGPDDASRHVSSSASALAFRGIHYAYATRFQPAELVPFAMEEFQERGPVGPQLPSRLSFALGPQTDLPQSEDCQVLSVFTPAADGSRPVMIWFHGGAHMTGGGELPWYDGTRLAAEQDVVVVSVSFRLGVLGNFHVKGHEGPTPSMTDQLTAIEWVHRNIHRFGGDPDHLVLAGQSAGAFAIEVMLRWGLGTHVVGAILQSGNLRDPTLSYSSETALAHSREFAAFAGPHDLVTLPVSEILRLQQDFAVAKAGPTWAPARPDTSRAIDVALLGGWAVDDDLPFTMLSQDLEVLDWSIRASLINKTHEDTRALYARPTLAVLTGATWRGAPSWAYRFESPLPGSPWGASHCIEIPFLLGGLAAWSDAAILEGVQPADFDEIGLQIRGYWANFIRNLNPGPPWRAWDPEYPVVNIVPTPTDAHPEVRSAKTHPWSMGRKVFRGGASQAKNGYERPNPLEQ